MWLAGLPTGCEKNPVIADKGGVVLLIRPSISMTMEVDVSQFHVGNKAMEAAHGTVMQTPIVLISQGKHHVKVAYNNPRTRTGEVEVVQLGEEFHLSVIVLRAVHGCEPPMLSTGKRGNLGRNMVVTDLRSREGNLRASPGDQNAAARPTHGEEEEILKQMAKGLKTMGGG